MGREDDASALLSSLAFSSGWTPVRWNSIMFLRSSAAV